MIFLKMGVIDRTPFSGASKEGHGDGVVDLKGLALPHRKDNPMETTISIVSDLVETTADTLRKSCENYWPAKDEYDPAERNVSLHFAHAMIAKGFSVFAEARHPNRQKVQRIDLLGLSPENEWFLGCEFKRLYSRSDVSSLIDDLERLDKYSLQSECHKGFGFVGGLNWVPASKKSSKILDIWKHSEKFSDYPNLSGEFESRKARLLSPQFVIEFPKEGRYYLLAAMFPIRMDLDSQD
jgi:hypothetical protein